MDKVFKEKQLHCLGIISIAIATLMLILVIVLPIMLKRKKTNDFTQKSFPTINNTNLWAKSPGDLNSTLTHKYDFFEYKANSGNSLQIELKSNFSIREEVAYSNFVENKAEDTIYFNTNRTYKFLEGKNESESINSINMGLFETLETMTYPPLFKIGINSIYYLITKTLIDPDLFIRELFTYKLYNSIDDTTIKTMILNNIPTDKIENIISTDENYKNYSFKTYPGLFQWIKIMGLEDKISKANWLSEVFNLTEEEISSIILNNDAYLITEYKHYNKDLAEQFVCENKDQCGIELLYNQLINGEIISTLFSDVKDYLSLNQILESNFYPFDKSPEMNLYFKNEYNIIDEKEQQYSSYAPSKEQLENLLNINSKNCLLSPNNSIYFLYLNSTEDNTKQYLDLTYNKINFLSQYFYDFLPSIFLYPKVANSLNDDTTVDPIAKTVATMFQNIVDKTYKYMPQIDLYTFILSNTIKGDLKKKTNFNQLDEICPIIMQKILDDGKKVNKICSDLNIGFNTEESLLKWIEPYYCFSEKNKDEEKCNPYIIDYLKQLVYITEDEINQIFSEDYLGGAINYGLEAIKSLNCGDRCQEKGYLQKLQFRTGNLTLNAPMPLPKSETIRDWFPDEIPYPIEISYYQRKYGNSEEFTEEDIDYMINMMTTTENKYDVENWKALVHKLNLEKEYSLYMKNKDKSSSLLKLVNFMVDAIFFKIENIYDKDNENDKEQSLFVRYSNIKNLIQGNDDEDKIWINYLSQGDYFDNFKPNIKKTTGLEIGLNLKTKQQENFNFDNYGINTNNANFDKRRINKMNNLSILNFKKDEYDCLSKKYINLPFPTFNYESLLGLRQFSDGFQYDHNLKFILYYDQISSRPLLFRNPSSQSFKDKIECKRYDLDVNSFNIELNEYFDRTSKNAMITQKVNKPFMISPDFDLLKKYGYDVKDKKFENYICIDPISDMVIDSKINLIYSINTRKYGFVNNMIENDQIYPIFTYQRQYEVEVDSYEKQFPGVTEYYRNMTVFIIIGIIVIVIFTIFAVLCFYYWYKSNKYKKDISLKQSLVPLGDSDLISKRVSNKEEEVNNLEQN